MESSRSPAVPDVDETSALAEALRGFEDPDAASMPGYVTLELDAEAFLASWLPDAEPPAPGQRPEMAPYTGTQESEDDDVLGPGHVTLEMHYVTLEMDVEAFAEEPPWQTPEQ